MGKTGVPARVRLKGSVNLWKHRTPAREQRHTVRIVGIRRYHVCRDVEIYASRFTAATEQGERGTAPSSDISPEIYSRLSIVSMTLRSCSVIWR